MLDKVLSTVEILPTHILEESVDPRGPSTPVPHRLFHAELRLRGEVVLAGLGRVAREEGEALFQKGVATTDDAKAQAKAFQAALAKFEMAARVPEEQCVALCNAAEIHLLRKE